MNREHPDDSIVVTEQITEKSPWHLKRPGITQTPVKDYNLTQQGKKLQGAKS